MESQTSCNVCGSIQNVTLANVDRYGLRVRTAMCLSCGLIYLADRFTAEGYAEFYGSGTYRLMTSSFLGAAISIEAIRRDQEQYASGLVRTLAGSVGVCDGGALLDVGGSAGVVAREVACRFGMSATVLDPATEEIEAARVAGLEGIVGSLETFEPARKYDLILLCRSLEHLFDLRVALLKMRALLREGGLLYCDIIDFLECCRLRGGPEAVSKIDHCYWLCQETAPRIFRSLGLEIAAIDAGTDPESLGYLLRRCEPVAASNSIEPVLHPILRGLREIDSEWRRQLETPRGIRGRLGRLAYRAKRLAWRAVRAGRPSSH